MTIDALTTAPTAPASESSAGAVIAMQSFRYVYEGASRPAVHELTFNVNRGEIFGFLGPSGAGKSTTQNALIGLLTGYEGSISVMGRDLRHWNRDYYQRIGVAFEAPNHYLKLTARENLRRPELLFLDEPTAGLAAVETLVIIWIGFGISTSWLASSRNRGNGCDLYVWAWHPMAPAIVLMRGAYAPIGLPESILGIVGAIAWATG